MPTQQKVLLKDISKEKTGFTPADKKQRGEGRKHDQGTDPDVSTESEIRHSNLDTTTPFVPPHRPSAVTRASSSLRPAQINQNDSVYDIMAPSGPATGVRQARRNLFEGSTSFIQCEGIAQKMDVRDVMIFAADAQRDRSIKLMEQALKSNSSTTALAAASFLSPLPYKGLFCRELSQPDGREGGIIIVSESCLGHATHSKTGEPLTERSRTGYNRCSQCRIFADRGRREINRTVEAATNTTSSPQDKISTIAQHPIRAENEIKRLRDEVKTLKSVNSKVEREEQMTPDPKQLIVSVIQVIEDEISKERKCRKDEGVVTQKEMWLIHTKHMLNVFLVDGNMRKVKQAEELVIWAIVLHARTSNRVYKEIAKVMKLSHISTVYKKGNELVSTGSTRAFSLCTVTLSMLSQMADRKKWNDNQRLVFFAIDSANINTGLQWDYVRNQMVGACEGGSYQQLRQMFFAMASTLQDDDEGEQEDEESEERVGAIMEHMRLAKEHCVAKMTSVHPDTKSISEVIASTDCEQFSGEVVFQMTHSMQQLVPNFNFRGAGVVFDAANPNWTAVKASASHSVGGFLPQDLKDGYPDIDFDTHKQIMVDVMGDPFLFLSDAMHTFKNHHTSLEKSSVKNSKRNLMYKNCPMNLKMVETVWLATGGGKNQMHPTKLSFATFNRDAKSRMDCLHTCRFFSKASGTMINYAIDDPNIPVLGTFRSKKVFYPIMWYILHMNNLIDITNGKHGLYTRENGRSMQKELLDILDWFSKWKKDHDSRVADGERTEYNFLATITWDCIRNLILGHVFMIQYYCIERNFTIHPRTLNTDPVEHHFGNCRQMVGGSTAGLTSAAFTQGDRKASLAKAAGFNSVGNCRGADDGPEHFTKPKKKF